MNRIRRAEFHSIALVALLLAVALSGCTDKSVECEGGVCRDVAQPGDVFLTNATRPVASWEGCQGVFMNMQLPRDMVDPYVPPGFEGLGRGAFLREVRMDAMDCPRATIDGHIIEPFRYATTGLFVAPVNESWQGTTSVATYAFELFVSNQTAADILSSWGLPAIHATIEIERLEAGAGLRATHTIDASDRSYQFSVNVVDQPGSTLDYPFTLWGGEGEYGRVDANYTRSQAINIHGPTTVTMTGAAAIAEILGVDTTVLDSQPYLAAAGEWKPHPTPFSSPEP